MLVKRTATTWRKVLLGGCTALTLYTTTCGFDQLEAVVVGFQAAADRLDNRGDDDISFGNWLLDELDDL